MPFKKDEHEKGFAASPLRVLSKTFAIEEGQLSWIDSSIKDAKLHPK